MIPSASRDDHGLEFVIEWDRWHEKFEQRRARPHGFLAITGLHWLSSEPARFDDVPGAWTCIDHDVTVHLDDDEQLTIDGTTITGHFRFNDVDEMGRQARFGDAIVEVARRDNLYMLRPRHPDNGVLVGYTGTPTFPPNIDWVLHGSFHPYDVAQTVQVGASVDGLIQVYESKGEVEFDVGEQRLRLVTFQDDDPSELFIVFTDETAGATTYPACRFLTAASPDADGHLVLDFNRATNPPCAYTEFATCPLPPSANHLRVRVEAGEMIPSNGH